MMIDIPVIETDRLRLRAPTLDDFEAEAAFFATDRSRFVGGPLDPEQVWRALAGIIGHWVFRGYGFWGIEDRESGAYYGRVGLWNPHGWPEPEIGWTLMENAEGKGIAREAALAARGHAYRALGWRTAISMIAPDNTRSIALAERLGATRERDFDHVRFGRCQVYRHPGPEVVQ